MSFTIHLQSIKGIFDYLMNGTRKRRGRTFSAFRIGLKVIHEVQQKKSVNDSETRFPLGLFSYPDLADHYEKTFPPEVNQIKIAVVVSEKFEKIGEFREIFCRSNCFAFAPFTCLHRADKWFK